MSQVTSELVELVALLCDDELSPEQSARLEVLAGESAAAQQYVLDSFQIHCELGWEFAQEQVFGREQGFAQENGPSRLRGMSEGFPVVPALSRLLGAARGGLHRWGTLVAAAALLVAVTLGLTWYIRSRAPGGGQPDQVASHKPGLASAPIARIEQARNVIWSDGGGGEAAPNKPAEKYAAELSAGSRLAIRQGLVQVRFNSGAKIIVQGPAELEVESPSAAALRSGCLTADVPPEARGFAVHAPNTTIVDLGTRFGVACQMGQTDVEVFAGNVVLRPLAAQGRQGNRQEEKDLSVAANNAVRVSGAPGSVSVQAIAPGSRNFVQSMAPSAAGLQSLVANDPHLIHYYPFQGATEAERLKDRRGGLDLIEVAMRDGKGGGQIEFTRNGPDPSVQVVAPFRAERAGSTHGLGLQSQAAIETPAAMTIELLLNLSDVGKNPNGFLASAVAARRDRDHCGFLVAAIGDGELACLLEYDAEWLRSGFRLAPGRWYYVAMTFHAKNRQTEVDAYAAELGAKTVTLNQIVKGQTVPGVAAPGLLCVGKAFDGAMASAYPWPGKLGQIAIYDAILNRGTLESHLAALTPVQPLNIAQP